MKRLLVLAGLCLVLVFLLLGPVAAEGRTQDGLVLPIGTWHRYIPSALRQGGQRCGTPPQLDSPSNGQALRGLVPTFVVRTADDGSAHDGLSIEYSTDPSFVGNRDQYSTTTSDITTTLTIFSNLTPGTLYYWHAQEYCYTGGWGPWSQVWTFATASGGVILPAPALETPFDGETGLSSPLTLTWAPVPGATGYQVWYSVAGSSSRSVDNTTTASYTLYWREPDTTFEWWVLASNGYGYGTPSAKATFTTGSSAPSARPPAARRGIRSGNTVQRLP
jgi:hypothetical protein